MLSLTLNSKEVCELRDPNGKLIGRIHSSGNSRLQFDFPREIGIARVADVVIDEKNPKVVSIIKVNVHGEMMTLGRASKIGPDHFTLEIFSDGAFRSDKVKMHTWIDTKYPTLNDVERILKAFHGISGVAQWDPLPHP